MQNTQNASTPGTDTQNKAPSPNQSANNNQNKSQERNDATQAKIGNNIEKDEPVA